MQGADPGTPTAGDDKDNVDHRPQETDHIAGLDHFLQTGIVPSAKQGVKEEKDRHAGHQGDEQQNDARDLVILP